MCTGRIESTRWKLTHLTCIARGCQPGTQRPSSTPRASSSTAPTPNRLEQAAPAPLDPYPQRRRRPPPRRRRRRRPPPPPPLPLLRTPPLLLQRPLPPYRHRRRRRNDQCRRDGHPPMVPSRSMMRRRLRRMHSKSRRSRTRSSRLPLLLRRVLRPLQVPPRRRPRLEPPPSFWTGG